MRQKLNIITLGVKDLQKSLEFYKKLGWEPSKKSNEDIVFINLGGIILSLFPKKLLAEDITIEEPTGKSMFTLAHNAKNEEEVDQVIKHAKEIGAKIIKQPQKTEWGGYGGYFEDPDGFLWEVAFNPFTGFDENDNLLM